MICAYTGLAGLYCWEKGIVTLFVELENDRWSIQDVMAKKAQNAPKDD